jgi:DNA mismatch repair ATPase MutS
VQELDRYLTSFLRTLIDKFSGLEEELYFCKAVLLYTDRLTDRNVKTIFPEFLPAEENTLVMKNLSDLLLLTESMSVLSVVPNDVSCVGDGSGTLVTGKNNSGKTVYLRSVGTAVLLSQCGLPIPAESAVISVRQGVYTTFAKAEGELVPLSSAGRFEEEVAQLSGILSRVKPGSLLLLNETFQTTAYDEGAEGMYHILAYLASMGCSFIFVTHLMKLKELYRGRQDIRIMKTSDDPRTRYKLNVEFN